jgi:hypothetical protein
LRPDFGIFLVESELKMALLEQDKCASFWFISTSMQSFYMVSLADFNSGQCFFHVVNSCHMLHGKSSKLNVDMKLVK